jgi:DNA-binding transcriptional regulator PaaX
MKEVTKRYSSSAHFILSSLLPYTQANMLLSFKPNAYFNELERISGDGASRFRAAYYRTLKKGLIELADDGIPRLTQKGTARLQKYEPKKLKHEAKILVIFDIPERQRHTRDRLRLLLRELHFVQIQKSVWQTEYDVLPYLVEQIEENHLKDYVVIFESAEIKL